MDGGASAPPVRAAAGAHVAAPVTVAVCERGTCQLSRHVGRELTMKALYQRDVGRGAPQASLDYLCAEEGVEGDDAAFARELLNGVLANLPELDRVIAAKAKEWRLDRLANVDRNILRLGVFELTHGGDVPASVAINEAVELAKVYGGPESGRFVNGVLGQVARELGAPVPEGPEHGSNELEAEADTHQDADVRLGSSEDLAPDVPPAAVEGATVECGGLGAAGGPGGATQGEASAGAIGRGAGQGARGVAQQPQAKGRGTSRRAKGGPGRGAAGGPGRRGPEGEPPSSAKRGS